MSRVGSTGCGWLAAVLPLGAAWLGSAVGANVGFRTDHDFDGLIGGEDGRLMPAVLAATAGISRLIYVKTCAAVTAAA